MPIIIWSLEICCALNSISLFYLMATQSHIKYVIDFYSSLCLQCLHWVSFWYLFWLRVSCHLRWQYPILCISISVVLLRFMTSSVYLLDNSDGVSFNNLSFAPFNQYSICLCILHPFNSILIMVHRRKYKQRLNFFNRVTHSYIKF